MKITILDPELLRGINQQVKVGILSEGILQSEVCQIIRGETYLFQSLVKSSGSEVLCINGFWFGGLKDIIGRVEKAKQGITDFPGTVVFYISHSWQPDFELPEWCKFISSNRFRQAVEKNIDENKSLDKLPEIIQELIK